MSRMRNMKITINLDHTNVSEVLTSIHPISCGPYAGHDLLLLMDDLCGRVFVIRSTVDGKHLSKSEKVLRKDGMDLINKMLIEQSRKDCDAVTGNGRWGCD